jgi:hypothetical protein
MKKIYSELSRIQRDLKVPKNLYNSFGKYKYRNAEGILEAVKPLLNGLVLVINDEPVLIGERFYIKATVTLTDGEESVSAIAYAREDAEKKGMDGCQLTGTCSSYARKYALNALLMIDDSKDSDDDSLSPKNPANQEEPQEEKQFTPPPAAQGTVNKVGNVPPPAPPQNPPQNEPEQPKPEPTEVQIFLLNAMKELREERKITVKQNNVLFADQKNALVAAGLAPNKALEKYTLPEAEALIDAMYKNFPPKSAEMIKK